MLSLKPRRILSRMIPVTWKPYLNAIRRLWPFAGDIWPYPPVYVTVSRWVRFIRDARTYFSLPGAEPFDFRLVLPMIHDRYVAAGDTGQYFYQDIWAFKRILSSQTDQHIDVGSRMIFVGMLTAITRVTFVDVRHVHTDLDNFQSRVGDLVDLPYPDNSVVSISCLHVAEHVGLGRYGDKLDPKGTEKAVKELIRVLAPNGNLFFSVPVGKGDRLSFNSARLYSISTLLGMFHSLEVVELSGVDGITGHFIENIDPKLFDEVENIWGGVALLWLKKPIRKIPACTA